MGFRSLLRLFRLRREIGYHRIGPDQEPDVRWERPYYVLPLEDSAPPDEKEDRIEALTKWIQKHPDVSDVFVFCHGWHRNFFSAVAAYDRLMSRLRVLHDRDRLGGAPPEGFKPLYIGLHWHSDPGPDDWVDNKGRRHKDSFLENAEKLFFPKILLKQGRPNFLNDFEDIYKVFADISAPGIPEDRRIPGLKPTFLAQRLRRYFLKNVPNATRADKVCAAWRCYFEASSRGIRLDQSTKPARTLSDQGSKTKGAGLTLRGFLSILLLIPLWGLASKYIDALPGPGSLWRSVRPYVWLPDSFGDWMLLYLGAVVVSVLCLLALRNRVAAKSPSDTANSTQQATKAKEKSTDRQSARSAQSSNNALRAGFVATAWLILFVPLLAVLLIMLLLGYLRWGESERHLFAERYDAGDLDPQSKPAELGKSPTEKWAEITRVPGQWAQDALSADSPFSRLVKQVDSFLAFWEMQRKAVRVGVEAARDLISVLGDRMGASTRLHFVGHSFGGLVVANIARQLAAGEEDPGLQISTLSLVQPAMASNWFEGESKLLERAQKAIVCVYSRYDTANGFYYPLANRARLAAGYVGLFGGIQPSQEESNGNGDGKKKPRSSHITADGKFIPVRAGGREWATLVVPPDYGVDRNSLAIVNVDASRSIYSGKAASGGGHNDIFKDDVVHMIWGAVRLAWPSPAEESKDEAIEEEKK